MLKRLKFLSTLFVLAMGSLSAYIHPGPGAWEVHGEFLYLFPSVDDTYFVIDSPSAVGFPNGTRENNDFHFHPGFRVGGAFGLCGECNEEIRVDYTRLRAQRDRTISGTNLFATRGRADFVSLFDGYAGTASADNDLLYHRLDVVFAHESFQCCPFDLYFLAGLQWDYVRFREEYTYASAEVLGSVVQKSRTWGIGPEFGLEFDYDLCDFSSFCLPGNLSVRALTVGSLLASKTQQREQNSAPGVDLNVRDSYTWRIIPAWHARIGLNYITCFSCFNAAIEVGYEFNSYSRALSRTEFPDDVADGLSFNNYHNFDLQGLYVSLAVSF